MPCRNDPFPTPDRQAIEAARWARTDPPDNNRTVIGRIFGTEVWVSAFRARHSGVWYANRGLACVEEDIVEWFDLPPVDVSADEGGA